MDIVYLNVEHLALIVIYQTFSCMEFALHNSTRALRSDLQSVFSRITTSLFSFGLEITRYNCNHSTV